MAQLGSVLIQPQMLARMQRRSPAEDLADETLALIHRLALDPQAQAAILPALQGAGAALSQRLMQRMASKLPQGLAALRTLIGAPVEVLTALAQGDPTPQALLGRIAELLDKLAGASDAASDDAIRAFMRRLVQVIERDIGIDAAAIGTELNVFVTDLRGRLAGTGPNGHALGCLLARLQSELLVQWRAPRLDAELLANLLLAELRRTGATKVRDQAACLLTRISLLLRALADVARELAATVPAPSASPAPAFAAAPSARVSRTAHATRAAPVGAIPLRAIPTSVPPRSADSRYCWYASWLYRNRFQGFGGEGIGDGTAFGQTICPGYPEDEVWLSQDGKALVLRRAGAADELLHAAEAPFEWWQAPQFAGSAPASPVSGSSHAEHFVFPRCSPQFLETWTQATTVLMEFAGGIWHLVNMGEGKKEFAVNIPMFLWVWARGIVAGASGAPLPSAIAQAAGWGMGGKYVFAPLPSILAVFAGSFEGVHTKTNAGNGFLQWLTLIGGDAINTYKIHVATLLARDFFLSLFTLINYDGPGTAPDGADTRPKNWDMGAPLIWIANYGVSTLFFKIIPRHDHGLPIGGNATPFLLWFFIGSIVAGGVGGFVGALTTWVFSRTASPEMLWKEPLKNAVTGLLSFLVGLYLGKEGDTDDGRYNPTIDADGATITPARQPFDEYPPMDNTPYRLPVAEGEVTYVGQANQGFFSHMRYNGLPQIYAYDFAHDFKDEILCVRGGTVVDWFDFFADDTELDFNDPADVATGRAAATAGQAAGLIASGQSGFNGALTGNWNFILVRHDGIDPIHDKDQGGTPVQTFSVYGHGATQGVRDAFATRTIAATAILGSTVQRGEVLMLAGDTGVSFHNHLHLHVQAATATTPATLPIRPTTLSNYTIPFVFAEGRHMFARNGPLRYLTWYRSQNTKVG